MFESVEKLLCIQIILIISCYIINFFKHFVSSLFDYFIFLVVSQSLMAELSLQSLSDYFKSICLANKMNSLEFNHDILRVFVCVKECTLFTLFTFVSILPFHNLLPTLLVSLT